MANVIYSRMIDIKVNAKDHKFPSNTSLEFILNSLKISLDGIAVAINEIIISKPNWSVTTLVPGDDVLIIKATQGG